MPAPQPHTHTAKFDIFSRFERWLRPSADADWHDPRQSEAWNKGYRAYFEFSPNPYIPTTASYRDWDLGYDDAYSLMAW